MIVLQIITALFAIGLAYLNSFAVSLFRMLGSTVQRQREFHAGNASIKLLWAAVIAYLVHSALFGLVLLLVQWFVFDIALNLMLFLPWDYLGTTAWLDKLVKNGRIKAIVVLIIIIAFKLSFMTNYYPEKPLVPYKKTTVPMPEVIHYLSGLVLPKEVKRATYIIFRIESYNGQKGINNNYVGCQADSGRWPVQFDNSIVGTVQLKENQTGKMRLFCAFKDFTASVNFLSDRVVARGLYVGGLTHKIVNMQVKSVSDLATAYQREWVKGDPRATPTAQELANFLSMYKQAEALFV